MSPTRCARAHIQLAGSAHWRASLGEIQDDFCTPSQTLVSTMTAMQLVDSSYSSSYSRSSSSSSSSRDHAHDHDYSAGAGAGATPPTIWLARAAPSLGTTAPRRAPAADVERSRGQ